MKTSTSGIRAVFSDDEIEIADEMQTMIHSLIDRMCELADVRPADTVVQIDFENGSKFGFKEINAINDLLWDIKRIGICQIRTFDCQN